MATSLFCRIFGHKYEIYYIDYKLESLPLISVHWPDANTPAYPGIEKARCGRCGDETSFSVRVVHD